MAMSKILLPNLVVPVSVVCAILLPIITGGFFATWTVKGEINKYDNSLVALTQKIEKVDSKVDSLAIVTKNERWTYTMMRVYSDELSWKNPSFVIPDYRRIKEENQPN